MSVKPTPMQRIVVTGLKEDEPTVVRGLHQLGVVEIIDYDDSDEGFALGRPFAQAEELSRKVLKARTLIKELGLEGTDPGSVAPVPRAIFLGELESRLARVEAEAIKAIDAREKARNAVRDQEQRLGELAPLVLLGFPLEEYREYASLRVFVGSAPADLARQVGESAPGALTRFVGSKQGSYFVAFVPRARGDEVAKALTGAGFSEMQVPEGSGDPSTLSSELTAKTAGLVAAEEKATKEVEAIAARERDFLLAAEDYTSFEVEKAEAPLRMAATKNSFILDGWIPKRDLGLLEKSLDAIAPGRVRVIPVEPAEGEEPPVAIPHSKSVGPFAGMLRLFAVPGYHEFDPTLILTVFFPIFFGMMVSDLGFGICLVVLGALMATGKTTLGLDTFIDKKAVPMIGRVMLYGGSVAALLGFLVFGEMFGIAFEHPPGAHAGGYSWAGWGIHFPILLAGEHGGPLLEKFINVGDLLAISVVFAIIHMGLGLVLGFIINLHHDKKHAIGKLGWLVILFGFFSMIMLIGGGTEPGGTAVNGWMGNRVAHAFASTIFAPFASSVFFLGGMGIPIGSIVLVLIGLPMAMVGEGPIVASLETLSLLSNIISYSRLAAVGVAEAGIHLGINNILLPQIIPFQPIAIVWIVLLFIAQLFVFILGGLSAGIQSLRLHFFEQFTKFYTGGGKEYAPFGRKLRYVKES